MAKSDKKAGGGGGLTGSSFGGLSRSRMAARTGGFTKRLRFDKKQSSLVQFYGEPDDAEAFKEYDVHSFKEDGNWKFVPCAGDRDPLDTDEDDDKRKRKYRFGAQVYDHRQKEAMVMEGPKDLAQRIFSKYEKLVEKGKAKKFTEMVWEVSQLPTVPVSYEVDSTDEKPVKLKEHEPPSIQEYIDGEIDRYHGEIKPKKSSLQARDDDEDGGKKSKKKSKVEADPPAKSKKSKDEEAPPAKKSKDKAGSKKSKA